MSIAHPSWPNPHTGRPQTYAERTSVPVPPPRLQSERDRLQREMWGDEEETE